MEKIKGEGDRKAIEKVRVRRSCDYCGEHAFYKKTYLNDGNTGARRNPASAAYGKDNCTWCSDFDDFLCPECHASNQKENVPEGYGRCSTFQVDHFPHMFLRWDEREVSTDEIRIVFDGPPSHESGRFVEVEDTEGKSIGVGKWKERDDGLWELRILGVVR